MCICGKCDHSRLLKTQNGYKIVCSKCVKPKYNDMFCFSFCDCDKENINLDISPEQWEIVSKFAKELSMNPNDFISKLIQQKMYEKLGVTHNG